MYTLSFEKVSIRNGLRLGIRRKPQIDRQYSAQDPPARDQHARSTPGASGSVVVSRRATSIPESTFSHRWETSVPTSSQLHQAERFFLSHPPVLLGSSSKFRTIDSGTALEVAFLGRSNVGKSSLLNALMGKNICWTSSKPGRTKTMNFFAIGGEDQAGNPGKVVVLDMPGYGKGSREEWGQEIMKYLVGRKQLRRAFLLVDAVHGLKSSDEELLTQLRRNAISHQIILSKVDRILLPGSKTPSKAKLKSNISELERVYRDIRAKIQPGKVDGPEALGEIISCSAEKSLERGRRPGINQVRWAVLSATGLSLNKKILEPYKAPEDGDRAVDVEIPTSQNTVSYVPYGSQVQPPAA